jgi:RNA polymerase sigma-70 factor (ECF subfamily)
LADSFSSQITVLLKRWSQGDEHALDILTPLVYKELRRIAAHLMKSERQGHSLQPTEVVNEAYLKFKAGQNIDWQGSAHFRAVAARSMRQILVDHARNRGRRKRGGSVVFTTLNEEIAAANRPIDILDLNRALDKLAIEHSAEKAKIVEFKVFAGMEHQEIAEVLHISTSTVIRHWKFAIALLRSYLQEGQSDARYPLGQS